MKTISKLNCYLVCILLFAAIANFGCAKTIQVHKLPSEAGDSKIFVFRPSISGYAIGINIYENRKIVGRVGAIGYIAWNTIPGEIILEAKGGISADRNLDFIKIEAQQGKTYYFKFKRKSSLRFVDLSLTQISETEAKKYLSKLKEPKINIVE